jgi:pimeloyl-ACP methyl ester carboxylesterase
MVHSPPQPDEVDISVSFGGVTSPSPSRRICRAGWLARFLLAVALAAALPGRAQSPPPAKAGDAAAHELFATVLGARIHYIDRGSGPVVVLVHGLADDANTWRATIDVLARNHRVLAPDLIGHGQSDKPLLNYRAQTFTDFLLGFLDVLHISRASFVGQSLGGWTIALVALQQPERVEWLVLVDSAGFADQPLPACINSATLAQSRELVPYVFATAAFTNNPAIPKAILTARVTHGDGYTIARFLESARRNEDVLDGKLNRIAIPTLIIWGEADRLIPLATGRRFEREIPGSQLRIVPGCGHDVQLECAGTFNETLASFLESKTEPGAAGKSAAPPKAQP